MNLGKKFEQQWSLSASKQNVLIIRLADSDLSYNPNKELRSKFTVKNPCDFILHYKSNIFFLELKSTKYSSIGFQRNPEDSGMILLHQINSLSKLSQYDQSQAGFVFNFRYEEENEHYSEMTYFMSIENFLKFYNNTDKKSINRLDIVQNGGFIVSATQKRKYYIYDVEQMLTDILKEE